MPRLLIGRRQFAALELAAEDKTYLRAQFLGRQQCLDEGEIWFFVDTAEACRLLQVPAQPLDPLRPSPAS